MKHTDLVSDDLWEAIEPFLPKEPPKLKGGRPRVPDRAALAGVVFVLKTGIPWRTPRHEFLDTCVQSGVAVIMS